MRSLGGNIDCIGLKDPKRKAEGKIKGWGHVGSKFVIRHFFFGAKRNMVGAD
jgi:hypothetical protein